MEQGNERVFEETMSVKEFADATGRFPNQIYELITKGNKVGKLKSTKLDGKIRVFKSEIEGFPFTPADALRIRFANQLNSIEIQLQDIENRINAVEGMLVI